MWGKSIYSKKPGFALRAFIIVCVLVFAISGIALASYADNVSSGLAANLVRLHVLANSDSEEDQQLKLKVRDRIIELMEQELKDSEDIEHTIFIINKNKEQIKQIALEEIKRYSKDYDVSIALGEYPFPTRMYGDIILPAGKYQALKVIIGDGGGSNWWCVLFPPLCFVDASHGTVPDSVKDSLKNILDEEEYSIATSSESDSNLKVRVKFKTVELFQKSKMKFTSFINYLLSR